MNAHDIEKYKNAKIDLFTKKDRNIWTTALSSLEMCVFKWDYENDRCFMNDFMIDLFGIDVTSHEHINESLSKMIDEQSLDAFFKAIDQVKENTEIVKMDIALKSDTFLKEYSLQLTYNHELDMTIGIMQLLDLKTNLVEQSRLRKMIRANELIMEIRDIVDHVDDLHEVFDYLLSKIHTVIPAANRSSILRIDEEEQLYIDTSYGFDDEYIEGFGLPFKSSFAYLHMNGDYTKSVIINDVQKKYRDLFPDLKNDSVGFNIQSNVTTPIVVKGTLFGIVSVDSDKNNVFDFVDLNLLDFIKIQLERAIVKYRAYRTIKRDSMIDSLTGVSNRRHLMDILPGFMEKARMNEKAFLFVVFDLDKLKEVNDTYGHVNGDKVIKFFANSIHENIRETDFFARIGGDEFVGLFYNLDESILQDRIKVWETIFKDNPIMTEKEHIDIHFSYGVSVFPEEGNYFSDLLELADKRMYQHKRMKK